MSIVRRPKAVLFDLLTALIDSWTLWNAVAGNEADGRRWRAAYLRRSYGEGRYRPYETLVAENVIDDCNPQESSLHASCEPAEGQADPG